MNSGVVSPYGCMKHEYEQRRADVVIGAGAGVLEIRSPVGGDPRMLLTKAGGCRARAFVEDFNPLLWLILHVFCLKRLG